MEIVNLSINKIHRDPTQPRQTFDQKKIKEMAQSILTEGIINPIEIDKNYTIITGEMRWRAAKVANLKEIPCKVITISDKNRFRRQVIENIHHNTMNDWDTGKALERMSNELPIAPGTIGTHGGKLNQGYSELGKIIGKPESYVREKISIVHASKEFKQAIKKGLSGSFIRAIKAAPQEYKKEIERKIISNEFKTRDMAIEMAYALERNPEKSEQILKAKDIHELNNIAPRLSSQIRESYNPVNELSGIIDKLVDWLKHNPPQSVGQIHAPRIIFNLSGAVNAINKWGTEAQQLKLKGK